MSSEAESDFGAQAFQNYLSLIETHWTKWLDAIAGLDDDQIIEPGTCGEWSVKDLFGHVAVWDEVAASKAASILGGQDQPPFTETLDEFNHRTWLGFRDRSQSDLQAWMLESHREMVLALQRALPAADDIRERVEYATIDDTWKHYDEHRSQIESRYGTRS